MDKGREPKFDETSIVEISETKSVAKSALPAAKATATVLIAEDEEGIRELACYWLTRAGFKVLEARNGDQAMQIAREYQGPVHLLLTDVLMPQMSGRELAEKLEVLHPGMKILYMSGYSSYVTHQRDLPNDRSAFLSKPFSMDDLVRSVRDVLDGGGTPALSS